MHARCCARCNWQLFLSAIVSPITTTIRGTPKLLLNRASMVQKTRKANPMHALLSLVNYHILFFTTSAFRFISLARSTYSTNEIVPNTRLSASYAMAPYSPNCFQLKFSFRQASAKAIKPLHMKGYSEKGEMVSLIP